MSPDRWRQIEEIYSEALNRDASEQLVFLAKACGDDEELRREVASLLAEAERTRVFLSSPRFETALRSVVAPRAAAPGEENRAPPHPRRLPAFFWFSLAIAVAVLAFYGAAGWVVYQKAGGKDFGWRFIYSRAGWMVATVYADGPAAGTLQTGDRVLEFNGDPRAERVGPEIYRQFLPPGSSYSIRVSRHGNAQELELRSVAWVDPEGLPRAITYFALSLASLTTGLAVALLKPRDPLARLCFATQILSALRHLATPLSCYPGIPGELACLPNQIVSLSFPGVLAVSYHFFYRFGGASTAAFIWRAIGRLLYAVTGMLLVSQLVFMAAGWRSRETLIDLAWRHFWVTELNVLFVQSGWEIFLAIAFGGIVAVVIWGYRQSADLDRRRRIRWFVAGCTVGVAPQLGLNLAGSLLAITGGRALIESTAWSNLRWIADGFLVVPPIALAFAVLKHRLLDIHVVVRRGMRYMLARRMLQAFLILPFLGLILPLVANSNQTLPELLRQNSSIFNLLLLALLGLSLKYRQRIQTWLDRRFFRESYRQEDILRRLMLRIKDLVSAEEVSKLVCNELDSAFHPEWLYVCQWRGESGRPAIVQASARGAIAARPPDSGTLFQLLQGCKPAGECGAPSTSAASTEPGRPEKPLVIPVATGDPGAGGAILLGEKKSEEPYTETDRRLLEGISGAIAVVFENFWLKKKVDEGLRERHEVLNRLDRDRIKLLKECPACGVCFDSSQEKCSADHADLALSLPVERTIAQRYRLDRRIGKGGMGVVFEAMDLNLNRKVAVKVMIGRLFGDQRALSRFEREARILARLNHPNIVAIHDFGRLGGEGAYLVMELLAGSSWRSELRRMGRIPPASAAAWFEQLLGALDAAHREGVVHRDLKPENVMIEFRESGAGLVKILDFGVAKMHAPGFSTEKSVTEPGVVMGTVAYMSPEQLRGEPTDHRSDLFSVAVMAVEAIIGRLPQRGADGAIADSTLMERIEAPSLDTRNALYRTLVSCLHTDPARRCAGAMDFRESLLSALRLLYEGGSASASA